MQEEQPKSRPVRLLAFIILLLLAVGVVVWHFAAPKSPVPHSIRSAVHFPVYFPDQSKLPSGYRLLNSSFSLAQPGVVIYSIIGPNGQRLIVSEEEPPSGNTISDFLKNYIPLHTAISTRLGQVQIGAAGTAPNIRTIASLVINKGPWVIITALSSTKPDDINQVVQALEK